MLFGYILQFIPDREKAGALLVDVFAALTPQLQKAFDSSLSIYCWLQVEARKIILEYIRGNGEGQPGGQDAGVRQIPFEGGHDKSYYFSLLEEASPEHQWVFRELFLYGRRKEELVASSGKDMAYISRILRECLFMIRNNLG